MISAEVGATVRVTHTEVMSSTDEDYEVFRLQGDRVSETITCPTLHSECPTHHAPTVLVVGHDPDYPDAGTLHRCPVNGCLWSAWHGVNGWEPLLVEAIEEVAA